ncbi:MAG: O-acetyl-ADP-ribose deacetylase [Planctomycetota bacterium]|jgi:O-acetyl-ADP-ribose deacetylase (regulator of RNase III)
MSSGVEAAVLARMRVHEGDITCLEVDAVVTAANAGLSGGGGVDGAVHRAAGPELLAACRALGGCPTGEARITPGFRLPARHVIHAVGPVWAGGGSGEAEALAAAYRHSLELAVQHSLRTIAFPCISAGVYGYPLDEASAVAVRSVASFLGGHTALREVVFCTFGERATHAVGDALAALRRP